VWYVQLHAESPSGLRYNVERVDADRIDRGGGAVRFVNIGVGLGSGGEYVAVFDAAEVVDATEEVADGVTVLVDNPSSEQYGQVGELRGFEPSGSIRVALEPEGIPHFFVIDELVVVPSP
jgi:hypothetical protein